MKGKFFGGESSIGFVDIVGNFIAFWVPIVQEVVGMELLTKDKFPKLCQWSHEFLNHGVVKENTPPKEELLTFYRTRYESSKESK